MAPELMSELASYLQGRYAHVRFQTGSNRIQNANGYKVSKKQQTNILVFFFADKKKRNNLKKL